MAEAYEDVMGIMLPTGAERKATYSPFAHLSGRRQGAAGSHGQRRCQGHRDLRRTRQGEEITQPVTGGSCKVQWKPDWALRWYALQVDYEMYGKDLIDSAKIAARITKALGGPAPEGFSYELFLDEQRAENLKVKGNGLSIEDGVRPRIAVAVYVPAATAAKSSTSMSSPKQSMTT